MTTAHQSTPKFNVEVPAGLEFADPTVTLTTVHEFIAFHDFFAYDDGVPEEFVVGELTHQTDLDATTVETELDQLKAQGEVYTNQHNRLATVSDPCGWKAPDADSVLTAFDADPDDEDTDDTDGSTGLSAF